MRFTGRQVDLYSDANFTFKQSERIKVGDRLPMDEELLVLPEGGGEPRAVRLSEVVGGRRAVIFGLPGAYTSVCSSKHVPDYVRRYDDLRGAGVDAVACLSVNDPWVMREWARVLGVDQSKVAMLADGEGRLHGQIGLLQHMPGLGVRAVRYSLLADDGVVLALNVEEPGGKSYKISGPQRVIEDLERLAREREGAS